MVSIGIKRKRETNLIIRRWVMPSAAGATKVKKSEGFIQDGTASTASITPSDSGFVTTEGASSGVFSRNTWTTPRGRFVEPSSVATNLASAGSGLCVIKRLAAA